MESSQIAAIFDLAARQHALVARRQVAVLGLTRSAWRHCARSGEWVAVTPRVLRRSGAPSTEQQRALTAILDVGPSAYLSHRSAAALWGLPGFDIEPLELIVVRAGKETDSSLAAIHRPRHLPDPFGALLDGVPVVRPALLLLQLAACVTPWRLRRALDHLWNRRLLSGPSVRRELGPLMHRGRAGTVALRTLLDSLPMDYVPPASGLEGRFAQILEDADVPGFARQVDVGDERWCGRVDFRDQALPLIVEVDSERYHRALTDVEADRHRQQRIQSAGFTVLRITDQQVWHRPGEVVNEVRRARARLQRALV